MRCADGSLLVQSSPVIAHRNLRAAARQYPRGVRGFTLLEVLLSLAIIALLGGVLIGGSAHLLSEKPVTTQEVFWKAIQEARKAALKAEHEMRLKFDKEKKQFVVVDGLAPAQVGADGFTREEVPVKVLPIPSAVGSDLDVTFLPAGKGGQTILLGGLLVESQPVAFVTFYSDGTCSPFRAQFMRNASVSTMAVDPWTCAPVLNVDPNSPSP